MTPGSPHAESDGAPWLQEAEAADKCSALGGGDNSLEALTRLAKQPYVSTG